MEGGTLPEPPATGHVVLLGDPIFDNKTYVNGGPDVIAQLRGELPSGWNATLGALDGDVILGCPGSSGPCRMMRHYLSSAWEEMTRSVFPRCSRHPRPR